MKFHKDAFRTQLWSLQMRGKKTYLFCRPDATNQKKFPMEGFVRNDKYEAVVEGLGCKSFKTQVRLIPMPQQEHRSNIGIYCIVSTLNVLSTPNASKTVREKCFEATPGPGDLIFWPSTWWHETR